jgi:uroporphyrin-III C-methyltransferase / precorrin-2 dehydrogenase / sirohydrochlorin ferrochelatase
VTLKSLDPAPPRGRVTLVGAGPGDPELLTLKAVRALGQADIILYDNLVAAKILDFARQEAKKMLVGKTGHGPSCKQTEINALMIKLAMAGKSVVRLKGGDPMLFGRAGEEIAACCRASIPVTVIPGITSAQGAAARLTTSLTHRDHARRVQYVSGHDCRGALPDLDWASLADPHVTTVVYMPVKTLPLLSERAIAAGLNPSTPAVAVARATRPDETTIFGTIASLPSQMAIGPVAGPVLVLIGMALSARPQASEDQRAATKAFDPGPSQADRLRKSRPR